MSTKLTLIAAVAGQGAIGLNEQLLWHHPEDLRHFKQTTLGHPVIMGRKTWDSLPPRFRPLPARPNIVLTRDALWQAEGALAVTSFKAALQAVSKAPQAFVIGGAQLYALALPWAHELVLTEVEARFEADTYFPPWDRAAFEEVSRVPHQAEQGPAFAFVRYRRNTSPPAFILDGIGPA